ncbi:MAG: DUF2948 family protein [Salaquimonas sp.]
MTANPRKIVALDAEDLQVLSAYCQDAILKAAGLHFHQKEKRFVVEMNRFRWEDGEKQDARTRSVLHFEQVQKAQAQGFDPKKKDQILSLLAILFVPGETPSGYVDLVFAGDITVRLEVECIEAQLADMNAVWAASSKPAHPDN